MLGEGVRNRFGNNAVVLFVLLYCRFVSVCYFVPVDTIILLFQPAPDTKLR